MRHYTNVKDLINFIENSKRMSPKINLSKMEYLCNLFDHPQNKFKSIHVTGTNGKGSVVAYLNNIFTLAGYNVGTYTSPYLNYFNERIMMANRMISDDDLLRLGNFILAKYNQIEQDRVDFPGFFEFMTLLAFLYYAEQPDLDFAIIEVGIGGRLDATNVITPLMSILTNISLDHQNVLNDTLIDILYQKLGIIKKNVPFITGIKQEPYLYFAQMVANNFNAPFYSSDHNQVKRISSSFDGNIFSHPTLGLVETRLAGYHQIDNALIAIKAIEVFNQAIFRQFKRSKKPISCELLLEGIKTTQWPGRLEVLSKSPLIVIDGAHNINAIERIVEFIKGLTYQTKRCIFSCSHDKDKEKMISLIEPYFDEIIFTAYTYQRHSDANELFTLSQHQNKKLELDIKKTIDYAWKNEADLNLFIGSLYFVAEIRPLIIEKSMKETR